MVGKELSKGADLLFLKEMLFLFKVVVLVAKI